MTPLQSLLTHSILAYTSPSTPLTVPDHALCFLISVTVLTPPAAFLPTQVVVIKISCSRSWSPCADRDMTMPSGDCNLVEGVDAHNVIHIQSRQQRWRNHVWWEGRGHANGCLEGRTDAGDRSSVSVCVCVCLSPG